MANTYSVNPQDQRLHRKPFLQPVYLENNNMDSPTGLNIAIAEERAGEHASSERTISGAEQSECSSSPTSLTNANFSKGPEPMQHPLAGDVIASPPTLVRSRDAQYYTSEIRAMADVVAQARKAGELPPTTSSPHDSEAIVHDYTALSQLRLARGDPALPPPGEYARLRIETSQHIKDRDSKLGDPEGREAEAERVEAYLRAVGQERRHYDLVKEIAKRRGIESQGADMERLMEEVMEAVEKGLDSTAGVLDAVACSLGGTTRTLNSATTRLNSTAGTLESTLGVMATQISTLNSQILALTNALQSHHTASTSPISPTAPDSQHHASAASLEDSVRKGIEHAICGALHGVQASTSHPPASPSSQNSSYSGSTLWERDSLSDSSSVAGTKVKKRSRRASDDKAARRAGKYVRIVINKILG